MLDSLHDVACPPFDQAVAELEAHVRATWQPLGILIAGSFVRGEAGPTSDLDVFVIHDRPWRLRAQRRFAGVPAELFVNPPAQIRRYFASEHAAGRTITGLRLSSAGLARLDQLDVAARARRRRSLRGQVAGAERSELRRGCVSAQASHDAGERSAEQRVPQFAVTVEREWVALAVRRRVLGAVALPNPEHGSVLTARGYCIL